MDRQSAHGGLRLGANPSLPNPGSRRCIRRDIYPPRSIDRHSRPPDVSAFTLAKRIRRTVDRLDPQGMPRSYRGVRRTPSAPCAAVLHGLLQSCFITPIRLCDWREEVLLIWMRSRGVIWVLPRAMNDALSRRFAEG